MAVAGLRIGRRGRHLGDVKLHQHSVAVAVFKSSLVKLRILQILFQNYKFGLLLLPALQNAILKKLGNLYNDP